MNSYSKYSILFLTVALVASCSPRMADVFEEAAIVRLEQDVESKRATLISAENGWVMEYFPQVDHATSAPEKHCGYTFLMEFREDQSVTVGGLVDGKYKTATSMWDIESDNSTTLTFHTFNSVFHYYSNPDPDMGLWGADGEGIGGDYEFLMLEYNLTEGYQLLKGKKRGCYLRMYPLADGEDWENYFAKLGTMQQRLFGEGSQWDMYVNDTHLSLYNAPTGEFRAFAYGADTLGAGEFYGFIITEKGLRLHDETILNLPINRAAFNLDDSGKNLLSVNKNAYITLDGITALTSNMNHGKVFSADVTTLPAAIANGMAALEYNLKNGVGSAKGSKKAIVRGFDFVKAEDDQHIGLQINYSSNGTNTLSNTFYLTKEVKGNVCTIGYEGEFESGNTLKNYKGEDFVNLFVGSYTFNLNSGFTIQDGMRMVKSDDSSFVINLN